MAGAEDGEKLIAECFGDEAAWIPYIRPGFTLARQVGAAVRDNPGLKLVVLAKHGLVVWGDTAEEAYRRTIAVINQAADFVNAKTAGTPRFGGPAEAGDVPGDAARARHARAPRRRLQRALEGAGGRHVRARAGVRALARRRRPHRRRRRLPRPPRPHQARPAVDPVRPGLRRRRGARRAHPRARRRLPRRVPRVLRAPRRRRGDRRPRRAGDPDPARRPRRRRHDDQERRGCRATSTTARSR